MEPLALLKAKKDGKSLRGMAREMGISAMYLHQVLNGKRGPGPKILAYLGLERVEVAPSYRKVRRGK